MIESKSNEPAYGEYAEYRDDRIHLGRLARLLKRSRSTIFLSLVAIVLLFVILAAIALLREPTQRVVTLPFRVEFQGADRGLYPNGTKFSSAEIVATPVLMRVYTANGLQRFLPFKEFSESVFVVQSNAMLEALNREYQAKLADTKLGAVDRERLEAEFRDKRESLGRNEYALTWASDQVKLPKTLVTKSLSDTLVTWADVAAKEKGVLRYQLSVVSANVLRRDVLSSSDAVVALDVLRTRIDLIDRNMAQLEGVPGTTVLRGGPENASLAEIRLSLADVMRYRVQPLILQVGAANATPMTLRFLHSQLAYNQRQAEVSRQRAEALRRTLEMYTLQTEQPKGGTTAAQAQREGGGDTVMPQFSDTFLDRLIELTKERSDIEYRQSLIDEIKDASLAVLPYEQEVTYYQQLLTQLRGIGASSSTADATVRQEMEGILASVGDAIRDANAVYALMSLNLNPSTVLYSVTSPPIATTERGLSLKRVALWGVLVFLISIPVVIGAVLLAARIKEDEELEEAREQEVAARERGAAREAEVKRS